MYITSDLLQAERDSQGVPSSRLRAKAKRCDFVPSGIITSHHPDIGTGPSAYQKVTATANGDRLDPTGSSFVWALAHRQPSCGRLRLALSQVVRPTHHADWLLLCLCPESHRPIRAACHPISTCIISLFPQFHQGACQSHYRIFYLSSGWLAGDDADFESWPDSRSMRRGMCS